MRKIEVNVNGRITFTLNTEDYQYISDVNFNIDDVDDVLVSDIADKYYSENDGWEDEWPLDIIFTEGCVIKTFRVEMEHEPVFYAEEIS